MVDDMDPMFTVEETFFGELDFGERMDMYFDALQGLGDGDLAPLADYIEAGFPIGYMLARSIADSIRGDAEYRLTLAGKDKRVRPRTQRLAQRRRQLELGCEVWRKLQGERVAEPKFKVDVVIGDVANHHGLAKSTVYSAWMLVSQQLKGARRGGDMLTLAQLIPEMFDITPDGTVSLRSK